MVSTPMPSNPFVLIRIISLELSTLRVWEIVSLFFLFEIKIEVYQKKKSNLSRDGTYLEFGRHLDLGKWG